jgi:predicted AAA+ superfamily ATPase
MVFLKRKIIEKFLQWKENKNALPLMLVGARQTGKSFIINDFCEKNFEHKIEMNFMQNEIFQSFFENSLNPADIIENIEAFFRTTINPATTIIFLTKYKNVSVQ